MAMVNCPECNGEISSKAMTCPHCGYPVKTPEVVSSDYVLTTGNATGSGFASFLKVLAVIAWIGGLIIAIVGANVTIAGYRSTYTEFSFGTFLTLLLPYIFYGIILFCMGTVVEQVADTYNMVYGIRLVKHEKSASKTSSSSSTKPSYLSGGTKGKWTCKACKHLNSSWETSCTHCGEPR